MTSIRKLLWILALFTVPTGCSGPSASAPNVAVSSSKERNVVEPLREVPETEKSSVSADRQIFGKIVGITDGDTVTILDGTVQRKIRLAGIDAPESHQAFGQTSKQNLSKLIFGRTVMISSSKTDRYGRLVGKIAFGNSDVNLEQIKAGLAWHYKKYANEQSLNDQAEYAEAETQARNRKLGLWGDPNPEPPWEKRQNALAEHVENVPAGSIIGNRQSRIYHTPGCSTYGKVSLRNQVIFKNAEEAERAGFRIAQNCTQSKD